MGLPSIPLIVVRLRPRARSIARGLVLRVAFALALAVLGARTARAGVSEPAPRADDSFDFMNLLARRGLHDLRREQWNAYGQLTWISSFKLPFMAPYSNLNGSNRSLRPSFEHSFTGTLTLFIGAKLWRGAEVFWVPEVISGQALSGLVGLGGAIQNFELQRQGSPVPSLYTSRLFFRQTFDLGGAPLELESQPMQLAQQVRRRRVVITIGNFSVLDLFDKNAFSGDLRRQLFNLSFLTYAAYDFAADARGYTWGGAIELFVDDWAVRFGHFVPPVRPNELELDTRFWEHFGQQLELEHAHSLRGRRGVVRILGYLNRVTSGRFLDAISAFEANPGRSAAACVEFNYGSTNDSAPDLCWVRRPNLKLGVGLNIEQELGAGLGLFLRGMFSDGRSEVYSYTSTDASLSFGALGRGDLWRRPLDVVGLGASLGWISSAHAEYLARGGVDGFVGDGALRVGPETVVECFYSASLWSSIWLSADYQLIVHPGFNRDRGPVQIPGLRLHAEF